jgi:hypothetical protein
MVPTYWQAMLLFYFHFCKVFFDIEKNQGPIQNVATFCYIKEGIMCMQSWDLSLWGVRVCR